MSTQSGPLVAGFRRTALIVGAGIGGLSCAIALARTGWSVRLLERSAQLSAVGAGIQLGPNAVRILEGWGLLEPLQACAFEPEALQTWSWRDARLLSHVPLRLDGQSRWDMPYLQVHRADLQAVLLEAAMQSGCELLLDHELVSVDWRRPSLRTSQAELLEGDLIIGADGIRSRVQGELFGATAARFTGQMAWRLLLPAESEAVIPPSASIWMGPGKHLVHYYVNAGQTINVVGVVERADWTEESWAAPGEPSLLRADFADAPPPVRRLLASADGQPCHRWGLFDRPALPRWHRGRVALLGDACHPMLPFLAQGAAMAIEDAWVLAASLQCERSIEDALERYTRLRKPRTDWVQSASRRNARIFHLRGVAAWARNTVLRLKLASPEGLAQRLYAYRVSEPASS